MIKNPWLLPDGIEEILPEEAQAVEQLRRKTLDAYQRWGYALVMTPMIEFIDSILGNLGEDLNLKTFKITDQRTGKTMGVRADITPQVARMDALSLATDGVNRLCYAGTVLHTRSDDFANTRSPLQIGCELFGHSGVESDFEIIQLMFETFEQAKIKQLTLDLGHVGIFNILAEQAQLSEADEEQFFDLLQRKAIPEIDAWLNEHNAIQPEYKQYLRDLVDLNGDVSVIEQAKQRFNGVSSDINAHLGKLSILAERIARLYPDVNLNIDLAELHGYHYKTGVVFAAYVLGSGQEIARGGRYDGIGKAFGCDRPATGFSADLKTLLRMGEFTPELNDVIAAPSNDCPKLAAKIEALRASGHNVCVALSSADERELNTFSKLGRQLEKINNEWQITGR